MVIFVMSGQAANLQVEKGAYVSPEARLSGTIVVRSGCIIHPKSFILAEAGPIFIGPNNIIEENCIIINQASTKGIATKQDAKKMQIGHSNHFQVGCQVRAQTIGDCNTFEMKSTTEENCIIGSGCTIGMGVVLGTNQAVEDNTTVFGPNANRQSTPNAKQNHLLLHNKHLEVLHKIFLK
mmetsp:Transcript_1353/g.1718  ORF Transcript_1353/g.1718 Transcript_1353/m.1718 type:complete len:180 (-) Transcript_1353:87-626(-)